MCRMKRVDIDSESFVDSRISVTCWSQVRPACATAAASRPSTSGMTELLSALAEYEVGEDLQERRHDQARDRQRDARDHAE